MPANIERGSQNTDQLGQHVLIGLGVTAAAVAAAAIIARAMPAADDEPETYTDYEDPHAPKPRQPSKVLGAVWPPLLMALTVSGLRIWNAPRSRARTQALTLWGVGQALNAAWMAMGPRRLGGSLATAIASVGTAGAYLLRARKVENRNPEPAAPYAGWMGVASALSGQLRRKETPAHTVH